MVSHISFIHSTCSFEHQEVWLSKNALKSKGHSFTKVPVKAQIGFTFKVNENAESYLIIENPGCLLA